MKRVIWAIAARCCFVGVVCGKTFVPLRRNIEPRRENARRLSLGHASYQIHNPLQMGWKADDYRRDLQESNYLPNGDPSCPCLTRGQVGAEDVGDLSFEDQVRLGSDASLEDYGFGCELHDLNTTLCQVEQHEWCNRAWCWVDPDNCRLLNNRAPKRPRLSQFYSYATCREADYFTKETRINELNGQTLRVAFLSNSGGWKGAYHRNRSDFAGPLEDWHGPMVEFVKDAAKIGKFRMELVPAPDYLRDRANAFWNDTGRFDFCVYAAALGIVDICIAQLTVTARRALAVDWHVMEEAPFHLLAQVPIPTEVVDYQSLQVKIGESFSIILEPFTTSTWYFLVLVVIPLMSVLIIVHEYGRPGSDFKVYETQVRQEPDGSTTEERVVIPMYRHAISSIYDGILGFFQWSYSRPISTIGAMIHLLGLSFMMLAVVAVYVANLAAILRKPPNVQSFPDSLRRGYRFCADRQDMQVVIQNYGLLDSRFATDPNDGKPGFLANRNMVMDRMDFGKADADATYCHVGIAMLQDLQVLKAQGLHCNKTSIDTLSIGISSTGFPVFEGRSPSIKALFTQMKNEGTLARYFLRDRPTDTCTYKARVHGDVDRAFSMEELSGIWTISASFAILGLVASFFKPWKPIRMEQKRRSQRALLEQQRPSKRLKHSIRNKQDFVPPVWVVEPPVFESERFLDEPVNEISASLTHSGRLSRSGKSHNL